MRWRRCTDGGGSNRTAPATVATPGSRWVPRQPNGPDNHCDAAIGRVNASGSFSASVCAIGTIAGAARAEDGELVEKHGRTTGYSPGALTDELIDTNLIMADGNWYLFKDQLRIDPAAGSSAFALGGD